MKNIPELLKKHGLSVTKTRSIIVDQFFANNKSLSILDLKNNKDLSEVNESSLYRNLSKLVEANLLRQVPSVNEFSYYELIPKAKHHHHIVCVTCSAIQCLSACSLDKSMKKIAEKVGFTLEGHSLELYGQCASCK